MHYYNIQYSRPFLTDFNHLASRLSHEELTKPMNPNPQPITAPKTSLPHYTHPFSHLMTSQDDSDDNDSAEPIYVKGKTISKKPPPIFKVVTSGSSVKRAVGRPRVYLDGTPCAQCSKRVYGSG